ncbi:MAG: glycyl-radical enzyme activating protein [Bacillota bacterium]
MSKKGLIFNIQRFSLHDGPGIRTTIFFKGCPLSCSWCQNPEGLSSHKELFQYSAKCIGCNSCLENCPAGAISFNGQEPFIDRGICSLCMICADNCPTGALEVVGKEMTINEISGEILKDTVIFEESGGGITLSGGEPLLQLEFAAELLKTMKAHDINTAVETSGYISKKALKHVMPWTDLFLYDLKLVEPELCENYTGGSSKLVIDNLKFLSNNGNQVIVRMPLIPGVNDHYNHLQLIADTLKENSINEIELIPYHNLGTDKYKGLSLDYNLQEISPPSKKKIAAVRKTFLSKGILTKSEV